MKIIRIVLSLAVFGAAVGASAQQHTLASCDTAYVQTRSDLILALRRALPLTQVSVYRDRNQTLINGLQHAVAHHGWDGSATALRALVSSHGLHFSPENMECPPLFVPVPVGYGACELVWSGAHPIIADPLFETRGTVSEVDGRVIFRAATRITLSVDLHGKAVFVTRGFIVTGYDVAAGTSTQGSSYGVNGATLFDGVPYEEFLQQEVTAMGCAR